tara:strand:+ start:663 stop:1565 length:903 start_codon:yes stop_codon:yes gene_type:complete
MKSFVFVNKKSGNGYGEIYFDTHLKNFINENFSEFVLVDLPCENHEYKIDIADNIDTNCLFIVGGDGTVSITIENIMKNSDFTDLNIPIYICPFGSGNGLAKNLNIDPYDLRLDGEKKYINPLEIKNDNNVNLSFLAQTWGIISDIDFNTEYLRYFGDFRFYYGILNSIFSPNYYRGKLDITTNDNNNHIINSEFYMFCASTAPWITSDFKLAPKGDIFSNDIDILIIRKKISLFERIKLIYYILNENIHELDFIEYFKASKYNLEILDNNSMIMSDGEIVDSSKINVLNTDKKFLFYCF